MTAPYRPELAQLITKSIEHRYIVTAHPRSADSFDLEVESGPVVGFSEDWSPYLQVSMVCAVPDSQTQVDQLDGRLGTRITIAAGYVLPDRTENIYHLADVALMDREINRPDNTMTLTGHSDELRAHDRLLRVSGTVDASGGLPEIIGRLAVTTMTPDPVSLITSYPVGHRQTELTGIEYEAGSTMWALMEDIASSVDARLFVDENKEWNLVPPVTTAGTPKHHLTVGEGGTLTRTAAALRRSNWYNDVVLQYRWSNGTAEQDIIGRASVTGGTFAVGAVGYRTYYESRGTGTTQTRANNTARAMLRNLVTRGRELQLTAAAAYWLRPSDTITVTLPTGEPEDHIIKEVSFNLSTGLMDIATRQPANVTITTGE